MRAPRCRNAGGNPRQTTVRTVTRLDITESADDEIVMEITGDGFLYNMVRIIAGTLVEVGSGMRPATEMPEIIRSADRRRAGHTAPPGGLYLKEVYYGDSVGKF